MKRLLIVCILVWLIGASIIPNISGNIENVTIEDTEIPAFIEKMLDDDDFLDQYQNHEGSSSFLVCNVQSMGQSFTPSYDVLTRVKLFLSKKGTPTADLHFYIVGDLGGTSYIHMVKTPEEISDSSEWNEFDFPDVEVNVGEKYYIVLHSTEFATHTGYRWYDDSGSNLYSNGEAWHFGGVSWEILGDGNWDLNFETYGKPIFDQSLVIGRIYDLNAEGYYVTCNALSTYVITFGPFSFNSYRSDEQILIEKPFRGIVAAGFVVAFCKAAVL